MPLEPVGLTPGGRGNRLYWVSGPQRRQIPRRRRTDTPPDLRFIRLPLWESPPEPSDRGNDPRRPWNLPLEPVGFAPCVRGIDPRSGPPWELPLGTVGIDSGGRGIDPRSGPPWESPFGRVGFAPGAHLPTPRPPRAHPAPPPPRPRPRRCFVRVSCRFLY